ncbi:unnamed protein product [Pleuronectes platessa]|uniref:Uncharacterized protein n=1 Tax=Pleuronectes platessa TaxID=8262 RepID=A0A9N7Z9B9_PLEPL|nr:unnamed protein product [Pleuronectes platessa]
MRRPPCVSEFLDFSPPTVTVGGESKSPKLCQKHGDKLEREERNNLTIVPERRGEAAGKRERCNSLSAAVHLWCDGGMRREERSGVGRGGENREHKTHSLLSPRLKIIDRNTFMNSCSLLPQLGRSIGGRRRPGATGSEFSWILSEGSTPQVHTCQTQA